MLSPEDEEAIADIFKIQLRLFEERIRADFKALAHIELSKIMGTAEAAGVKHPKEDHESR